MDTFNAPQFRDNTAARQYLEALLWPDGPVCPHCGVINHAYATKRPGVYRCAEKECRKDFSVTMKTVMERSKIALHKWLQAFHLMASSKKGISAHQLHRTLHVTYEAAWFMAHRIREAMRAGGVASLGGGGGVVEADETFIGRKHGARAKSGYGHKMVVMTLVERSGKARSFKIDHAGKEAAERIIGENVSREARLMTDSASYYKRAEFDVADHQMVNHDIGEYARYPIGKPVIHTNTIESYYSVFKRGMKGTYQHCREKHLHRYAAEFDFRHNTRTALGFNDGERAALAVKGVSGKRLTYRGTH
ncbi:MAG: IS1595 family transposase [Xanthobacteraceae bacterium]|jgi:transposase-like protein